MGKVGQYPQFQFPARACAPGLLAGLIQINARVPASAATGDALPVVVTIGGGPSQTGATMAVK